MSANEPCLGARTLEVAILDLVEEDRRDLARALGHFLRFESAAAAAHSRLGPLASLLLKSPEADLTEREYDSLRPADAYSSDQLSGWFGSWPVAKADAIRWALARGRGSTRAARVKPGSDWNRIEASLRLRDAAREMGLAKCSDMHSRLYLDLQYLHWQRRRLRGTRVPRWPDRDRIDSLWGKDGNSFARACKWADDHFDLGKEDQSDA